MAVGSQSPGHNKAEILFDNSTDPFWVSIDAYPYSGLDTDSQSLLSICTLRLFIRKEVLARAAVIHAWRHFYVIGGWAGYEMDKTDIIARLDTINYEWSMAGRLTTARYWHGATVVDDIVLVVGGDGNLKTERCAKSENDNIECVEQEPRLYFYYKWPEMFIVDGDYCTH